MALIDDTLGEAPLPAYHEQLRAPVSTHVGLSPFAKVHRVEWAKVQSGALPLLLPLSPLLLLLLPLALLADSSQRLLSRCGRAVGVGASASRDCCHLT